MQAAVIDADLTIGLWQAPSEFLAVMALWMATLALTTSATALIVYHSLRVHDTSQRLKLNVRVRFSLALFFFAQGTMWIGTYIMVAIHYRTFYLDLTYLAFALVGIFAVGLALSTMAQYPRRWYMIAPRS
jgi:uncharacterized membrane protein